MGLGQSVVTPFASGIIGAYFSEQNRGIAFSIFNFGTYASFSLSLSLGTFMYDEYGWQSGYLLFGLLGMVVGVAMPLVMSDKADEDRKSHEQGTDGGASKPLLWAGSGMSFASVPSEGSYYEIEEDCYDEVSIRNKY